MALLQHLKAALLIEQSLPAVEVVLAHCGTTALEHGDARSLEAAAQQLRKGVGTGLCFPPRDGNQQSALR